jgi:hypothetical protein
MSDLIQLPVVNHFSGARVELSWGVEITPDIARQIVELGGEPRTVNELLTEQANAPVDAGPMPDCYGKYNNLARKHRECELCTEQDACKRRTQAPKPADAGPAVSAGPCTHPATYREEGHEYCDQCGEDLGNWRAKESAPPASDPAPEAQDDEAQECIDVLWRGGYRGDAVARLANIIADKDRRIAELEAAIEDAKADAERAKMERNQTEYKWRNIKRLETERDEARAELSRANAMVTHNLEAEKKAEADRDEAVALLRRATEYLPKQIGTATGGASIFNVYRTREAIDAFLARVAANAKDQGADK